MGGIGRSNSVSGLPANANQRNEDVGRPQSAPLFQGNAALKIGVKEQSSQPLAHSPASNRPVSIAEAVPRQLSNDPLHPAMVDNRPAAYSYASSTVYEPSKPSIHAAGHPQEQEVEEETVVPRQGPRAKPKFGMSDLLGDFGQPRDQVPANADRLAPQDNRPNLRQIPSNIGDPFELSAPQMPDEKQISGSVGKLQWAARITSTVLFGAVGAAAGFVVGGIPGAVIGGLALGAYGYKMGDYPFGGKPQRKHMQTALGNLKNTELRQDQADFLANLKDTHVRTLLHVPRTKWYNPKTWKRANEKLTSATRQQIRTKTLEYAILTKDVRGAMKMKKQWIKQAEQTPLQQQRMLNFSFIPEGTKARDVTATKFCESLASRDPDTALEAMVESHLTKEFSAENANFLRAVHEIGRMELGTPDKEAKFVNALAKLRERFIAFGAEAEINVPGPMRGQLLGLLDTENLKKMTTDELRSFQQGYGELPGAANPLAVPYEEIHKLITHSIVRMKNQAGLRDEAVAARAAQNVFNVRGAGQQRAADVAVANNEPAQRQPSIAGNEGSDWEEDADAMYDAPSNDGDAVTGSIDQSANMAPAEPDWIEEVSDDTPGGGVNQHEPAYEQAFIVENDSRDWAKDTEVMYGEPKEGDGVTGPIDPSVNKNDESDLDEADVFDGEILTQQMEEMATAIGPRPEQNVTGGNELRLSTQATSAMRALGDEIEDHMTELSELQQELSTTDTGAHSTRIQTRIQQLRTVTLPILQEFSQSDMIGNPTRADQLLHLCHSQVMAAQEDIRRYGMEGVASNVGLTDIAEQISLVQRALLAEQQ